MLDMTELGGDFWLWEIVVMSASSQGADAPRSPGPGHGAPASRWALRACWAADSLGSLNSGPSAKNCTSSST